jgi:hypothetical protein
MGVCAEGFQSHDSVGANVAAGLLGSHRICVWTIFDSAEAQVFDSGSDAGLVRNFSGDAGTFDLANALEEKSG